MLRFNLIFFLLFSLVLVPKAGFSQLEYTDKVYDPNIRSVQFYYGQDERTYPFIFIGDPAELNLEFDEWVSVPGSNSRFYAAIVNCDAYWQPSGLMPIEYLTGFSSYLITDWRASVSTRIPYVHYWYPFSLSTFGIKRSGNYLLYVYRDGDEDHPVLSRRFVVAERLVGISNRQAQSYAVSERSRLQTLSFEVYPSPTLNSFNPSSDLLVVLMQNGRWDNCRFGLSPMIITPEKLEYSFDTGLEFEGGNEYRMIDIRSTRFRTQMMKTIEDRDSLWYILLFQDKGRRANTYTTQFDFNGGYVIGVQEYPSYDWQADYVWVRFSIESEAPLKDKTVYLSGRTWDWRLDQENKLEYNTSSRIYETTIPLKQGIYDYKYVVKGKKDAIGDEIWFEGSHYETENYYTILVYFKGPSDLSHRLVGMLPINYVNR